MGKDGGSRDDEDEKNEDDNRSKGGVYLILASAGADRLVHFLTRRKDGGGGCKGKVEVGMNSPGWWECRATLDHGTLWEENFDEKNGRGNGSEKNENNKEKDN